MLDNWVNSSARAAIAAATLPTIWQRCLGVRDAQSPTELLLPFNFFRQGLAVTNTHPRLSYTTTDGSVPIMPLVLLHDHLPYLTGDLDLDAIRQKREVPRQTFATVLSLSVRWLVPALYRSGGWSPLCPLPLANAGPAQEEPNATRRSTPLVLSYPSQPTRIITFAFVEACSDSRHLLREKNSHSKRPTLPHPTKKRSAWQARRTGWKNIICDFLESG